MISPDLPRVDSIEPPGDRLLRTLRPLAQRVIRQRYDIVVHGSENFPSDRPVIVASNHIGLLDGPLLAIFSPRPVHVLTKREMFDGRTGRGLRAAGQVPLNRTDSDPAAIKTCVKILQDGGVVGVYPEGTRGTGELLRFHAGAAYLALVTGAPVVPVMMFGSRPVGGGMNAVPSKGERIDMVFGRAIHVDRRPWPRTREQVRATSVLLHKELLANLDEARALTGRELPGPISDLSPDEVVATRPASTKELLDD